MTWLVTFAQMSHFLMAVAFKASVGVRVPQFLVHSDHLKSRDSFRMFLILYRVSKCLCSYSSQNSHSYYGKGKAFLVLFLSVWALQQRCGTQGSQGQCLLYLVPHRVFWPWLTLAFYSRPFVTEHGGRHFILLSFLSKGFFLDGRRTDLKTSSEVLRIYLQT